MALTPFVRDGQMVMFSDLVLAISVYNLTDDFGSFVETNRFCIHEDETVKNWKPPRREERASTEDPLSCVVLLTWSHPPKQSRSHFILGRDPETCDVVFDSPSISRQHIKINFEDGGLAIEDISTTWSRLSEEGQLLWGRPERQDRASSRDRAPRPRKELLTPRFLYDLSIPGFQMQFKVEPRHGHEKLEFEKKRNAWMATLNQQRVSLASEFPIALGSSGERDPPSENREDRIAQYLASSAWR